MAFLYYCTLFFLSTNITKIDMKKCQIRRNRETRAQNFLRRPIIVGGKFLGNSQFQQTPNFFKVQFTPCPINWFQHFPGKTASIYQSHDMKRSKVLLCENNELRFRQFNLTHLTQPSVAFHIETSHLICTEKQITVFFMKCNTGLRWVQWVRRIFSGNLMNI